MLAAGKLVNEVNHRGQSAAFVACEQSSPACLEALIEAKADLNLRDRDRNPVIMACLKGNSLECLHLLVKAGVRVDDTDAEGHSTLLYCLK